MTSPRDAARRGARSRPPARLRALRKELAERGILCEFRPESGLRPAPDSYNRDEELGQAVWQIVESGAYEPHLHAAARF